MTDDISHSEQDPRHQAMHLYWQGMKMASIAERVGENPATVRSWKLCDKWDDYTPLEQMQAITATRYNQLIMKLDKAGRDFKEIDLLARQAERHARIGKYNAGGNEADLNPNVENRNRGPRKKPLRNALTPEQHTQLKALFLDSLYDYQRTWYQAGLSTAFRIRNLLKSAR